MRIKVGRWTSIVGTGHKYAFISFLFTAEYLSHILFAVRSQWRVAYVCPHGKHGYRRLYLGFFEIEWAHFLS